MCECSGSNVGTNLLVEENESGRERWVGEGDFAFILTVPVIVNLTFSFNDFLCTL